ncbi:MAG: hypothetical protein ACYDBT_13085 [Desulfobulbaceae bacterium]
MTMVRISGLFYRIFLICSLAVVPCVYAGPDTTVDMESQTDQLITIATGDSIQIEIKNAPLHDALNAVTQKSKINFEVPESLLKDRITLRFVSKDWPEAIKRMLKKYNIAYGWEHNELKTVFIFERGTGKVLQLVPAPEDEMPPVDPTESSLQGTDGMVDESFILSLPPLPTEEDKIIEIKFGAQNLGRREKKLAGENKEDGLGLPPELDPDLSGVESENPSGVLIPEDPALPHVK